MEQGAADSAVFLAVSLASIEFKKFHPAQNARSCITLYRLTAILSKRLDKESCVTPLIQNIAFFCISDTDLLSVLDTGCLHPHDTRGLLFPGVNDSP